ncbi:MAG: CpsD/CapB family tyrosine-protein kinase [Woeseia sp.]|nr:CpsD/CapB family tyrosine-protein kinase [Woeseia sp.]MBT8095880.1 CpsD/CapB family tyrosine-protein kinase [Woeseia sp.]NNE61971.1 CpsD/CapB family tyrosine-protein kinase [Woeseia sp.]
MGRIEEALRKAKVSRGVEVNETAPQALNDHAKPRAVSDTTPLDLRKSKIPSGHVFHADKAMLREQRIIAASEHDERVGSYRQLRTLLLKTMRDNDWSTLAITSAHKGAGKSVTSTNLAISLSRDVNTTVLLVDLDLNTPTVHEKLGLKAEQGLVDFLEGNAELEDIVFDPGIDGLMVLAGRSAGKEMSELLASPKLQQLVADLHRQDATSVTIFDLPPLLRNDDAILFAPYADAVLVVVEDGVTTEKQLRHALQLLDKANVIGTIINKARY